ncbi:MULTISPECIES: COG3014 family protein [Francisella]|uniref:Lipoprotein n=1 Tax=Francisella opportunistica TaxID=2016517 RepID=A0A345JPZ0_9GAMM|nr:MULTISPECIES: hypothetical protein [Francisella]APC91071.1 putative lipoprotein [Francisella sp. MA067296]AXH29386.1 hypothetical protein CGC43_01680 [Francisella opportunistica]AXH31037.1 hypothetical protein CGC44_01660 [Francisella opportunistica]AXH32684.1 hypothetical protein CGC45_01660 [Francisella opportunistica]
MKAKSCLLLLLCGITSSCATFSGSHPSKVGNAKKAIETCQYKPIETKFIKTFDNDGVDAAIGFLETGRFEQLIGNTALSQKKYTKATDYVAKSEAEAKIRVRNILKDTQATLLSDKERYYYISDYEITFLYAYQALNYLKQHDLENAAVSIRNLSYAQYATFQAKDLAAQTRKTNYQELSHVNSRQISSNITSAKQYRQLAAIANRVKNSYENAFGYYLEAIIYQSYDTDLNNANLSMSNAFRVVPDNPYVSADYQQIKKAFDSGGNIYPQGQGKLVIIYESGWVESLKKFDIPITVFFQQAGVQKISLPYYSSYNLAQSADIKIFRDKKLIEHGKSALLVDTTAMAAKSLADQFPAIVTREVLRLVAKTAISVAAIRSSGDYAALAAIGTSIYNLTTTQADQRSWNLLPKNVDLFSKNLAAGSYTLKINNKSTTITLQPQKITLVWLIKEGCYERILLNQVV